MTSILHIRTMKTSGYCFHIMVQDTIPENMHLPILTTGQKQFSHSFSEDRVRQRENGTLGTMAKIKLLDSHSSSRGGRKNLLVGLPQLHQAAAQLRTLSTQECKRLRVPLGTHIQGMARTNPKALSQKLWGELRTRESPFPWEDKRFLSTLNFHAIDSMGFNLSVIMGFIEQSGLPPAHSRKPL